MFTNNYIAFRKMMFRTGPSTIAAKMKTSDGSSVEFYPHRGCISDIGGWMTRGLCKAVPATYSGSANPQSSSGYFGVYFGTDSTPATKEDYCLGSTITSGLTITSGNTLLTEDDGCVHSVYATYSLQNTTDQDISVSEIGIFTPACTTSGFTNISANDKYYTVLMERTVLDEPIIIQPGKTKLVTYKVTFNQTMTVE